MKNIKRSFNLDVWTVNTHVIRCVNTRVIRCVNTRVVRCVNILVNSVCVCVCVCVCIRSGDRDWVSSWKEEQTFYKMHGCNLQSLQRPQRLSLGQPIFWPKNFKFWLYNLQILTLFWPINFLRLQLQNISSMVLRLTQKHIDALKASKFLKIRLFNFGDDILIYTLLTTVKSNLRTSEIATNPLFLQNCN